MRYYDHRRNQRGVALIVALGFTFIVLAFGLAVVRMTTNEQVSAKDQSDMAAARNVAEAALDRALLKLGQDPTWRCTDRPSDFTDVPLTVTLGDHQVVQGTYTVDPIEDLDGDSVQITAHGYYPNATDPNASHKVLRVIADAHYKSDFCTGLFGVHEVKVTGLTDSYNSAMRSYAAQTPGIEGDVRTDSTKPDAIKIDKKSHIYGKAIFGPGTDMKKVKIRRTMICDGDGDEANDVVAANARLQPAPVVVPDDARLISELTPDHSMDVKSSITIPAGTWVCNKIELNEAKDHEPEEITTTGTVKLYVRGDIKIDKKAGGIVNNGDMVGNVSRPQNLRIYCTPACKHINWKGSHAFSAVLYAPNTHIDLHNDCDTNDVPIAGDPDADDNGQFYGSIIGDKVHFKHKFVGFHYDTSLKKMNTGEFTNFKVSAWQAN